MSISNKIIVEIPYSTFMTIWDVTNVTLGSILYCFWMDLSDCNFASMPELALAVQIRKCRSPH